MPKKVFKMFRFSLRRLVVYACLMTVLLFLIVYYLFPCKRPYTRMENIKMRTIHDQTSNRTFVYDRSMPLIFIGGVPRSGTTLMRAILDAHPEIRCGEETRVIPRILGLRDKMLRSKRETERLSEAGIDESVLDSAMSAFILELIVRHGEPANRLCNKDPLTMKSASYMSRLFPNAKFILMLRDGRAVVNSIITRKVTITGFDLRSHEKCLRGWNKLVQTMYEECHKVGPSICLKVHYEQLVLHPRKTMTMVLKFLDITWNNAVMKHEQFIGKPGGISLSKTERSTSQVIQPVNLNALTSWVGKMPPDVVADMPEIAPMLSVLGYDPRANPPNYGVPDAEVSQKTSIIRRNSAYWLKKANDIVDGKGKNDVSQRK